jgi:hypothetical protein
MVRSLISSGAFHEGTRWVIYVPNVGRRSAKNFMMDRLKFEHEADDLCTKVTIGDLVVMEPRIHFRTDVLHTMESLGFECVDHGSTEDLWGENPPQCIEQDEWDFSKLFHYGIFRYKPCDD